MNQKVKKELQKRKNIMIDDARREKLAGIGGGNLSKGIRIAADFYKVNKG